ncbi:MAG: helix-turn-helix domain-containing protein [Clostridiales Family XIII bacterium]|jgi:transcriptional regulator with XRE-family HTH domain|nr:helix-turn-helix domain-containing protein [Clostridiales Family XIII bacterium]
MLNERLQKLISTLGIRKCDFADKIGFSSAYISMILSEKKRNPSPRFYAAIAREFSVGRDWLQGGSGEMFSVRDADLSDKDAAILKKYHKLPLSERKIVDDVIDAMLLKNACK